MGKIFFVTGSMSGGGAERVISILANYYSSIGWDVSILMLLHSNVEYKLNDSVNIVDLSKDKNGGAVHILKRMKNLRTFVQNGSPDAVLSFMGPIVLLSGIALCGIKVRHITSERIDPSQAKRNCIFRMVLNSIYKSCYKCVLQTKRAWNYFPEKIRRNSVIIPNPITVECEVSDERRKRIVTAGRLNPQKNHKMLIDAFYKVHKRHPEYILDIYGKGKCEEELNAKIKSLGLEGSVFLKGASSTIHKDMADAEIFALSSDFEGLSNALLEAMMMGHACVSTNCAGSDEVIADGENGLLVDVGNAKQMEEALEKLISDEELRIRLGKNAKESAKAFYVDNVIDMWRKVIEG